ncbi:MAG: cbb3-type cytochrome c oxidase subunit 3 [Bdellovibrionaceae bacterium]|nr:cbb3-type cytochrome c oxidase subunit 3 [Pseudobdellovibrionaceae bacterium]MDW8190193.1 cbb3-type cytochrome c oxidase subunit 3 [Pseudobdellovibrionaceae bacterium]
MSRFLSNYSDTTVTLIGFVIFFTLFVLIVMRTYSKSQKSVYQRLAQLPLDEVKNSQKEDAP